MLKIVFIALVDPSGTSGQNIATKEVAKAFIRHENIELILVCPKPRGELPEELKEADRIKYLPEKKPRSIYWHLRVQFSILHILYTIIKEQSPDAFVERVGTTLIPAMLAKSKSITYLSLIRGIGAPQESVFLKAFYKLYQRQLIIPVSVKIAQEVYAAYQEVVKELAPFRKDNQSEIQLFPNAVDPELFVPFPINQSRNDLDYNFYSGDFVIGFVGSLKERHCLDYLINAASKLYNRDRDIKLMLVGDGPQRRKLEQKIRDRNLEEQFIFTGFVPHHRVPKYIAACDVMYGVVHPESPSNPIKNYEYLACSRPIISSEKEEFQFVKDIDVGLLVGDLNSSSIAEAIKSFHSMSRTERLKMGKRGRKYVLQNNTWSHLIEDIYQAIT